MIVVKCFTTCGDSWTTRFNGTENEARKYFLEQQFNISGDKMVTVDRIDISPCVEWVTFTRRTNGPKLTYLRHLLDTAGIPNVMRGRYSWHAPILEVPKERLEEANSILDFQVMYHGKRVSFDDIPDDDPMFMKEVTK